MRRPGPGRGPSRMRRSSKRRSAPGRAWPGCSRRFCRGTCGNPEPASVLSCTVEMIFPRQYSGGNTKENPMKLKHVAFLASVLALAACGVGKQEGDVRFSGFAPVTGKDKDIREVRTFCPGCGDPIAVDTARCPNKRCKTDMSWRADYRCPSCKGSGVCAACAEMEQSRGDCYNCRGQGVLIFQ